MTTMNQRMAARIREIRETTGLSQERFAEKLGTTRRSVIRWEMAYSIPSPVFRTLIEERTGMNLIEDDADDEESSDLDAILLLLAARHGKRLVPA